MLGHRRAPSLESAAVAIDSARKAEPLYERAFSVITTILPSEKTLQPAGMSLNNRKTPVFIALGRIPVQK
jgi:hypothetical protein